jgi:ribosomal protein S18 acetylase RimI-like enzyme
MKNFEIVPMDFPGDKYEIAGWEIEYGDTPGFQGIREFILENQTYRGLHEVIETNHEIYPIGDDEIKYSFVVKTKNKDIIAWLLLDEFDINTTEPELFLQYICIHPLYQNKGYGEAILNEILSNPKKYLAAKPTNFFAYIKKNNIGSQKLFKKFNFNLRQLLNDVNYLKAETKEPKLLQESQSSEPRE